jgi:hypothetical protein
MPDRPHASPAFNCLWAGVASSDSSAHVGIDRGALAGTPRPAGKPAFPGTARIKERTMNRPNKTVLVPLLALLLGLVLAFPALAQPSSAEPGKVVVSIYHVAPGKQLEFLRWMSARDALSREAGVAATQWYAHTDGDSWDYVGISPQTTAAQDDKVDELAKRKGMTTGFKSGLEFRTLVASHTDTFARGPMTAGALVDAAK